MYKTKHSQLKLSIGHNFAKKAKENALFDKKCSVNPEGTDDYRLNCKNIQNEINIEFT